MTMRSGCAAGDVYRHLARALGRCPRVAEARPPAGNARLLSEDPAFGDYHVDEPAVLYLPLTAHIRDLWLTRAAIRLSRDDHARMDLGDCDHERISLVLGALLHPFRELLHDC